MSTQSTPRYLAQMFRFVGRYGVAHAILWGIVSLTGLVPGLIARAFFDDLSGAAPAPTGIPGLVLILVALALGQAILWLIAGYVEIVFRFRASALLRRNLLAYLLARPGALALPGSSVKVAHCVVPPDCAPTQATGCSLLGSIMSAGGVAPLLGSNIMAAWNCSSVIGSG